jgi:4a-hydroxytetrahydrobiopterin dehydratase
MDWTIIEGKLTKTFTAGSFSEVVASLQPIANMCDEMDHHPDVEIFNYKYITFSLITHSAGKITELDYELAEKLDSFFV